MSVENMITLLEIVQILERRRDLEHLQHMLNMEEQEHRDPPAHSSDEDSRSPLNFLPLDFKTGGPSEDSRSTVGQYLTRDQTRHIYKR